MSTLRKIRSALGANGSSLIWLFVTYIPAVLIAAYMSHWLLQTYLLGFIVAGGGYAVAFGYGDSYIAFHPSN